MLYRIGQFILDTEKEILLLASTQEVVTHHSRISQVLTILVNAYPKTVNKNELTSLLWPEDDVTEWALSRQISQVRQLLASYDAETQYIRTVHTKGFKLDLQPELITSISVTDDQVKPNTESGQSKSEAVVKQSNKKWLLISLPVSVLVLGLIIFFSTDTQKIATPIYGEITAKQHIVFPIDKNWTSSATDTIRFTSDGIHIEPIGPDSLFVSTHLKQPAFYQGADFSVRMKVNQAFVDNKGWLRLYYQTTLEGWPGEWDCGVDDNIIQTLDFEYHCVINENGSFVKTLTNETLQVSKYC
jgi:DNA-binding winged helix-turn-helix (wHTH) protein